MNIKKIWDENQRLKQTGLPLEHGRVFLIKSDLSNVHIYSSIHWTSHFLQGTRKRQPYLNGDPVLQEWEGLQKDIEEAGAESQRLRDEESQGRYRNLGFKLADKSTTSYDM